jgi:hypothetical protein
MSKKLKEKSKRSHGRNFESDEQYPPYKRDLKMDAGKLGYEAYR